MQGKRMGMALLALSVGGFLMMTAGLLLMPLAVRTHLPGLLFWLGLLLAVALQLVLEIRRRRFFAVRHIDRRNMQKPRCGLLTFGSNVPAAIADIALAVCVVALIIVFFITKGHGYSFLICIAATVFTFCMHCVLNGRNYFHVTHYDTVVKAAVIGRNAPERGARKKRGRYER